MFNIKANRISNQIASLNSTLLKKLFYCWMASILAYIFSFHFDSAALAIANETAKYIPSVSKLLQPNMALDKFAGKYFGVSSILIPIFVLVLIWNEDILVRITYSTSKGRKNVWGSLFFAYFLGVPFFIVLVFVFYEAPFEFNSTPRLTGQIALHLMTSTYSGALLLGSILVVTISVFISIVIGFCWLPFAWAFKFFKGEHK